MNSPIQTDLDFERPAPVLSNLAVVDPSVHFDDLDRLSKNALAVYERLLRGPATGIDLLTSGGGMRYGARVHDLRQIGLVIDCDRQPDGNFLYTLRNGVARHRDDNKNTKNAQPKTSAETVADHGSDTF